MPESAKRLAGSAALASWPGCGRSAWISAMKTLSVPRSAWIESDAAMSIWRINAMPSSRARISCPSMPSVPLMSARPSFSASSIGARPASASASSARRRAPPRVTDVTFAHQGERHVRERREVTRAAERSELVHDGGDAGVEQRRVRLRRRGANARDATTEIGEARDHHRAHHFGLDLGTNACCVGTDERALELAALVGRYGRGRERTEAGREPIDRLRRESTSASIAKRWRASRSITSSLMRDRLKLSRCGDHLCPSEWFNPTTTVTTFSFARPRALRVPAMPRGARCADRVLSCSTSTSVKSMAATCGEAVISRTKRRTSSALGRPGTDAGQPGATERSATSRSMST